AAPRRGQPQPLQRTEAVRIDELRRSLPRVVSLQRRATGPLVDARDLLQSLALDPALNAEPTEGVALRHGTEDLESPPFGAHDERIERHTGCDVRAPGIREYVPDHAVRPIAVRRAPGRVAVVDEQRVTEAQQPPHPVDHGQRSLGHRELPVDLALVPGYHPHVVSLGTRKDRFEFRIAWDIDLDERVLAEVDAHLHAAVLRSADTLERHVVEQLVRDDESREPLRKDLQARLHTHPREIAELLPCAGA